MKMRICSLLLALMLVVCMVCVVSVSAQEADDGEIHLPGISFGGATQEGTAPSGEDTKPVAKPEESKKPAKDTAEDKAPDATAEPVTPSATQPTEKTPDPTEEAVDLAEPEVPTIGAEEKAFPWETILVAVVAAAIGAGTAVLILKRKS